ncbi:MAG: FAD-binding domain-containing protein [Verrucomicrobiales bacterium]
MAVDGGLRGRCRALFQSVQSRSAGRKFDPEGAYVRQWLPEIAALPTALIHEPWTATDLDWRAAGLQRGQSYPDPIVGLTEGRDRALSAYQELKNLTSS